MSFNRPAWEPGRLILTFVISLLFGLHPIPGVVAELTVHNVDLLVHDADEGGALYWQECEFSLAGIHTGGDAQELNHNGYWMEIEISALGGGFCELDLLLLDEGVTFRQLVDAEVIPLDLIRQFPIRGNRTVQLDISGLIAQGLASGIVEYRFAIGRLDIASSGVIELFPGGNDQVGRIIAVQTN